MDANSLWCDVGRLVKASVGGSGSGDRRLKSAAFNKILKRSEEVMEDKEEMSTMKMSASSLVHAKCFDVRMQRGDEAAAKRIEQAMDKLEEKGTRLM